MLGGLTIFQVPASWSHSRPCGRLAAGIVPVASAMQATASYATPFQRLELHPTLPGQATIFGKVNFSDIEKGTPANFGSTPYSK